MVVMPWPSHSFYTYSAGVPSLRGGAGRTAASQRVDKANARINRQRNMALSNWRQGLGGRTMPA